MTAEEIFSGKSENIEFKSEIPAKSEKYMKTVVAFANGKGGKLVFGVDDDTCAVTGFSKEEVFQKMVAITNAIFDSCELKITPNIAVQGIDGKAIIVVEIIPGMQRPYYVMSLGIIEGTSTGMLDSEIIIEKMSPVSRKFATVALQPPFPT